MRTHGGRWMQREGGQALVFVAVLLLGLVAVTGLATDGGLVFAQRRDLQNLADAAALAGAMQIDETAYRAGSGVALNQAAARQAASTYLTNAGEVTYEVIVGTTTVAVTVHRRARTGFLRVMGIDGFTIGASAHAEPRVGGIESGP